MHSQWGKSDAANVVQRVGSGRCPRSFPNVNLARGHRVGCISGECCSRGWSMDMAYQGAGESWVCCAQQADSWRGQSVALGGSWAVGSVILALPLSIWVASETPFNFSVPQFPLLGSEGVAAPTWDPCEGLGVWWPGRHGTQGWDYKSSRISQSQAGARLRGVQRATLQCWVASWRSGEHWKFSSRRVKWLDSLQKINLPGELVEGLWWKDIRDVEGTGETELMGIWIKVVAGLERGVDGLEWMECGWKVGGVDTPGAWLKENVRAREEPGRAQFSVYGGCYMRTGRNRDALNTQSRHHVFWSFTFSEPRVAPRIENVLKNLSAEGLPSPLVSHQGKPKWRSLNI